jgi:hypothetical protein
MDNAANPSVSSSCSLTSRMRWRKSEVASESAWRRVMVQASCKTRKGVRRKDVNAERETILILLDTV